MYMAVGMKPLGITNDACHFRQAVLDDQDCLHKCLNRAEVIRFIGEADLAFYQKLLEFLVPTVSRPKKHTHLNGLVLCMMDDDDMTGFEWRAQRRDPERAQLCQERRRLDEGGRRRWPTAAAGGQGRQAVSCQAAVAAAQEAHRAQPPGAGGQGGPAEPHADIAGEN